MSEAERARPACAPVRVPANTGASAGPRSADRAPGTAPKALARLKLVLLVALATQTPGTIAADGEMMDTSILTWRGDQQLQGFRSIGAVAQSRALDAGDASFAFVDAPQDLSSLRFATDVGDLSLAEYMERDRIVGLLAIRDGEVRYERYAHGNDADSRWISFSVAKSVSSMMLGAALHEGYIASVDDPVTDYLPQLRGSAYGESTIEQVLQMSSGVAWNEDYADPDSDVARAGNLNGLTLYAYLNALDVAAAPGERFNYNTAETNLIGGLVRAAVGDNLAHYATRKLWGPFMASDATWLTDPDHGVELGGCCINATLRDYARIGQFAMDDGVLPDGTRVLPEGWMRASTTPSTAYEGYGYQWWLPSEGAFMADGIFGQTIWIHPTTRTIIVTHGAWPAAVGRELEARRAAMLLALHGALDP